MPRIGFKPGTKTLSPDSEIVKGGLYAPTTLSAVDADLATANIKNGITIFGVAGHTNVRDVSDANALVGEVMDGRTFFAVGGAVKTGTMATRTLSPDNDTVQAGYYAATTLHDVDEHLASINIKAGVTIFGFAGNANVVDTSSGDAVPSDIKAGKIAWVDGAEVTGDIPEVAIVAGSEAVPAGIHTATTLSAIDGDLAVGNIKSGVIIFGFTGAATIQDISDADAGVGDVKDTVTFYSGTGARKTGTMPTVAITDVNDDYPAGYHAGNVGGLVAIDAQLVTGSIKSGVTIFGVAGHTNVRDSTDADLTAPEAPTGKTFYAGGGARKTGSGTKTLNPANENVAAGYYAATTLSAVDAQLAVGNIKKDINIFGFVGTFDPSVEETEVLAATVIKANLPTDWTARWTESIPDSARLVFVWMACQTSSTPETTEIKLVYDGVQKAYATSSLGTAFLGIHWAGEGLGSTADMEWQEKGSVGYEIKRAGGGWYV